MSDDKQGPANDTKFKPGNEIWQMRKVHGKPLMFDTPEKLWQAALEYFKWNDENPLYEVKAFASGGRVVTQSIPKMRIMTVESFCLHAHTSRETFNEYRKKSDYVDVCSSIDTAIREQKLSGAASGFFNAMIIARDLGLRENASIDHSSADGSMSPKAVTPEMTPKEAADAYLNSLQDEQPG